VVDVVEELPEDEVSPEKLAFAYVPFESQACAFPDVLELPLYVLLYILET